MNIKVFIVLTGLFTACNAFAQDNQQSPWNMSFLEYKEALNKIIKADIKDGSDGSLKNCHQNGKDKSVILCSFADGFFQSTVKAFKSIYVIDGKFEQNISIKFTLEKDHISEIFLSGSRTDPANMLVFASIVINVLQTFNKDIVATQEDLSKLNKNLGISRIDSAKYIGEPRSIIENWGVAECLTMPYKISSKVSCVIKPRS